MGSLITPLRKRPYPAETDVPDACADIASLALALELAPNVSQGKLSDRPAPAASGNLYLVTGDTTPANNGIVWWDLGTAWTAVNAPQALSYNTVHSWTWDDQTSPNPLAYKLGAFTVYPAAGETVSLVGALFRCDSRGTTPSQFAVLTDHGARGTFSAVTGLSALAPSPGGAIFNAPTAGPLTLDSLDTVVLALNTAGSSQGCEVSVITQHTVTG